MRQAGDTAARQAMMAILVQATAAELQAATARLPVLPAHSLLRAPEIGLVMLRGRIGGDGAAFNVGEATVTRAAVSLESGEVGFGHVLGRDPEKARLAALFDALWQRDDTRDAVETLVLAPVAKRVEAARATGDARTAATKVDFFTMVRGDD